MSRKGSRLDWRTASVGCVAHCIPLRGVESKTEAVEAARKHKASGCPWTFRAHVSIEVQA